jgi:hypothetical protein
MNQVKIYHSQKQLAVQNIYKIYPNKNSTTEKLHTYLHYHY